MDLADGTNKSGVLPQLHGDVLHVVDKAWLHSGSNLKTMRTNVFFFSLQLDLRSKRVDIFHEFYDLDFNCL